MGKRKNNLEISFLKGIGIIAVVLGHTYAPNFVPIIYYWHLPLFFFLIGLTYNPEKYEKDISRLIASRLHAFWNYFHLMSEPLGGALWFMFPYFYATLVYGVIMSLGALIQLNYCCLYQQFVFFVHLLGLYVHSTELLEVILQI